MIRILIALGLAATLTACSSIPKEYTSPCACDWRPLNESMEASA